MPNRERDPQYRDRPDPSPFARKGHTRLSIKDIQYIKAVEDAMSDFAPTFGGGFNANGIAVVAGPLNFLSNGGFENDGAGAAPPTFWSTSTPAGGGTSTLTVTAGSVSGDLTEGTNYALWAFQTGHPAFEADAIVEAIPENIGSVAVSADLETSAGGLASTIQFVITIYDSTNTLLATMPGDTYPVTDGGPYVTFSDQFDISTVPNAYGVAVSIILTFPSNTVGGETARLDNVILGTGSVYTGLHKGKIALTGGTLSGNLTINGNLKVIGTTSLVGKLIHDLTFDGGSRTITNAGSLTVSTTGSNNLFLTAGANLTSTVVGAFGTTAAFVTLDATSSSTGTAVHIYTDSSGKGDVMIESQNGFGKVTIQDAGGGTYIKSGPGGGSINLSTTSSGNIVLDATSTGSVELVANTTKGVTIQGHAIEPTGGSTGYVLTQQSDGSFIPAAVSAGSLGLTTNHILVGSAGGVATDVALSGDATIVASGALTLKTSGALAGSWTTTTQSRVDNSTKLATTAYADRVRLVCTSSTHPSSPSVGDEIFETDTGKVLYYVGATDGFTPPWNTAWGELAVSASTANNTTTGAATDVSGMTATVTCPANRLIRTYFTLPYVTHSADGGLIGLQITDGSGSGYSQQYLSSVPGNSAGNTVSGWFDEVTTGGTITRKLQVAAGSATATVFGASRPGQFSIVDLGPYGNPS